MVDLVTEAPSEPVEPSIEFRDVRFGFGPDLPLALDGVSFTVRPADTPFRRP